MTIDKHVRKRLAEQGVSEEEALKKRMELKAKEFVRNGSALNGKM